MNLQQCRYVDMVARMGSFSQAAKELFREPLKTPVEHLERQIYL